MFINKTPDGKNNVCGAQIAHYRKLNGKSQRELADILQLAGLDLDKNAIQRMRQENVLSQTLNWCIWQRY